LHVFRSEECCAAIWLQIQSDFLNKEEELSMRKR
jgi:hypothetical protein